MEVLTLFSALAGAFFIVCLGLLTGYFIGIYMMLRRMNYLEDLCKSAMQQLVLERPDRAKVFLEKAGRYDL